MCVWCVCVVTVLPLCCLQVRVERLRAAILSVVRPSVDYLLHMCFKGGNLPSSLESGGKDRLVHWCHGCPGLVHLLALSYRVRWRGVEVRGGGGRGGGNGWR